MTDYPSRQAESLWQGVLCQHRKIVNSSAVDSWRAAVIDAQSMFVAALPRRPDLPERFPDLSDSDKIGCFAELTDNQHLRTAIRIRNKHTAHRHTDSLVSDPGGQQALTREEALCVVMAFEEALIQIYGFPCPEPPTSAEAEFMRKAQEVLIEELRQSKKQAEDERRAAEETVRDLQVAVDASARLKASAADSNKRRELRQYARRMGLKIESVQRSMSAKRIEELTYADIDKAADMLGVRGEAATRQDRYRAGGDTAELLSVWQWATGRAGKLNPRTVRTFCWAAGAIAIIALLICALFR